MESHGVLREPSGFPWKPSQKREKKSQSSYFGGTDVAYTRLAEVGDLQHAPRAQQQIGWLDVPMEQALRR